MKEQETNNKSKSMTFEEFMKSSGKDVLRDVLFYMLDTQSLVNLSKCSKSLYGLTAAHRFHKRAMDKRGASGIEGALANYQDILEKESLKQLLTKRIKTRHEDNDQEDIDYSVDTLLQLAWRKKDVAMCRIIKGYADLIDESMALRQITNFQGKSFHNIEVLVEELNNNPHVEPVSRVCKNTLYDKYVDEFLAEMDSYTLNLAVAFVISIYGNFILSPGVLLRFVREIFIPYSSENWMYFTITLLNIGSFYGLKRYAISEIRKGNHEYISRIINKDAQLKLLEKIGREEADDQKMFLDELGIDNDAQDPHDDHDHNGGGKKHSLP